MDELVKEILKYGLVPTILVIVIFLLVQDPNRGDKLKAWLTKPFYRFKKWFSRTHIASEITSTINTYLNSNLYEYLIFSNKANIKIRWVRKAEDPYFSKDGNLILRIKEDEDQTKNIFKATQIALPQIVCPHIRFNLDDYYSSSIDLALMQKLADKIGRHGKLTFKKYFLNPETKEDARIGKLIGKLITLDKHGVFTPILLNELDIIGDELNADSDFKQYTQEAEVFVEYLLKIVERDIGSEIELNYLSSPFKVGTILLAVSRRADTEGLRPYLKRLRTKIDKGCESIYIIAFPNSFKFFERLIKSIDSHESILLRKVINTSDYQIDTSEKRMNFRIALLSANKVFGPNTFKERIEANDIKEGEIYTGIVDDISEKEALINLLGLRAYVRNEDCSWAFTKNCNEHLSIGNEYSFKVISINEDSGTIFLTRRLDEENPWNLIEKPDVTSVIEIKIITIHNRNLIGRYNNLNVIVPFNEISWFEPSESDIEQLVNKSIQVKVIGIDSDNYQVRCSIRELEEDPWPQIHQKLLKGAEFNGKVIEIDQHFVRIEIENSIVGILPKESLIKAGYEYENFNENLKVGQGLEVYVSKVFLKKQKIRFDLTRNKNTT